MKRAILYTISCCLTFMLVTESNSADAQEKNESRRPRFFQRLKEDLFGARSNKDDQPPGQPSSANLRSASPDDPPAKNLGQVWNRDRNLNHAPRGLTGNQPESSVPKTIQVPPPSRGARPTASTPQRDADWFAGLRPESVPTTAPGRRSHSAATARRGFGMTIQKAPDGRLVVTRVAPDGNAQAAGIRPGDVVVELGGITATAVEEFTEIEKIMSPGDQLEITIRRGLAEPRKVMLQWGQAAEPEVAAAPDQEGPIGSGVPTTTRSSQSRGSDFVPKFVPENDSHALPSVRNMPSRDVPARSASSRLPRPADAELLELRSIVADQQKLIRELQQEVETLRRAVRQRSSRR